MSFFRGTRKSELEALRREVAELRQLVATRDVAPSAEQSSTATTVAKTTPVHTCAAGEAVSRRGLLRALPAAAAVGVVGAVGSSLLQDAPAAAAAGSSLLLGRDNNAGSSTTILNSSAAEVLHVGTGTGAGGAYTALSGKGITISDRDDASAYLLVDNNEVGVDGLGVWASFTVGGGSEYAVQPFVRLDGPKYDGKEGSSGVGGGLGVDVWGPSTAVNVSVGTGLTEGGPDLPGVGIHVAADPIVSGAEITPAMSSTGIVVDVANGPALLVNVKSAAATVDSIAVANTGVGRALVVTNSNTKNSVGAITGISNGTSAGVWGATTGSNSGPAVVGWATSTGRGGRFKGGAAAINLAPGTSTSHPSSGMLGDLVVDSTSRLWFCKGGTNWHQLA